MVSPDPHNSPEPFDEELAERGRLLIAAAVAETRAPLALRERIETDRARRTRSRVGWRVFAPVAGVVAAVAIGAFVMLFQGLRMLFFIRGWR